MDVYKVDPATFKATTLVEGFSSMIWTERFRTLGEFEMRTPLIQEFATLLPEDTLITHKDTQEVFIVDTLAIDKNEEGEGELVITGFSFEKALEDRTIQAEIYSEAYRMPYSYSATSAVAVLIYNAICNTSGQDLTKAAFFGRSTLEQIANVGVAVQDAYNLPPTEWWLEQGEVYPIVLDWMARQNIGLRNVRPLNALETNQQPVLSPQTVVTASRAVVSEPRGTKLRMEVYTGYDRSRNQTARPQVTFQYDEGVLTDPKYLFSTRGLKNLCQVISSVGNVTVYADDAVSPYLAGRQRRQMQIDGGDQGTQDPTAFISALVQMGEIELAKHNRQQLFDAEISEITPFKYKKDYDLGDKVSLHAEYGFRPTMMVNEYVRIDDDAGDRGFPTLILA